jgi:hypothetical protein
MSYLSIILLPLFIALPSSAEFYCGKFTAVKLLMVGHEFTAPRKTKGRKFWCSLVKIGKFTDLPSLQKN